jgi:2,3-bisphosphoglycerate-dependent phosphoglycerate mutase
MTLLLQLWTNRTPDIPFTTQDMPTWTQTYFHLLKQITYLTQSLKDTIARLKSVLDNDIMAQIRNGKNVLVVGHGNTIRSILKVLRNISDQGRNLN